MFATQVLLNNIRVTLLAFAGGLLFGLRHGRALGFNGLLLGMIGGLAFGAGNGEAFVRLVSSHGPLELSCIVVGGVAGLRLGPLAHPPRPATRLRSLQHEARQARRARARHGAVARAVRLPRGARHRAGAAGRGPGRRSASGLAALFWGCVAGVARRQSRSARDFARR